MASKRLANRLGPLRWAATSLAVAVAAYLASSLLTGFGHQFEAVLLAILLGGGALVVWMIGDFGGRLGGVVRSQQEHADRVESMLDAGFSKFNDATELLGLVEASALRSDVVIQLVRNSTQLDPASPALITRFARSEIARVSEFLKDLGDGGNVTYDGEDRDWMLALTRCAEASIDATSLSAVDANGMRGVDADLWTSDLGQRYLDAQLGAIQRGVRVRRILIVDQPALASFSDFRALCHRQREIGIHVRILDATMIPGTKRASLFDFVLFDDVISYEMTPVSSATDTTDPRIVNTRLELRRAWVRDRIQRYKDLWASAKEPS